MSKNQISANFVNMRNLTGCQKLLKFIIEFSIMKSIIARFSQMIACFNHMRKHYIVQYVFYACIAYF